jgi:hypothetical protein
MELVKEAAHKIGPFVHPTKHVTKITKLYSFTITYFDSSGILKLKLSKFFNGLLVTTLLHVLRL